MTIDQMEKLSEFSESLSSWRKIEEEKKKKQTPSFYAMKFRIQGAQFIGIDTININDEQICS